MSNKLTSEQLANKIEKTNAKYQYAGDVIIHAQSAGYLIG